MSDINIVFTRVDNRLVHGQVGNVWVTASGANLILVVDDETCHDRSEEHTSELQSRI